MAWECAALARSDKLKPLAHYLDLAKPRARRSTGDMIATLRDAAERGMPLRITRVE